MGNFTRFIVSSLSIIPFLSWPCVSMQEMSAPPPHENGLTTSQIKIESLSPYTRNGTIQHTRDDVLHSRFITLDQTQGSLKPKTSEILNGKTVQSVNSGEQFINSKKSLLHDWAPQKKTKSQINKKLYPELLLIGTPHDDDVVTTPSCVLQEEAGTFHEWKPQKKKKEMINITLYQKLLEKK